MTRRAGRPRRADFQLTRQLIIEAAHSVVESEGLDALSMRRLATELGVDPMSIYHHVSDKQEIVQELVRLVFAGMKIDYHRDTSWTDRVRRWAGAYSKLARSHPYIVLQIVNDTDAVATAMLEISEPLYEAFEDAGLPDKLIAAATDTLVDFLNGSALGCGSEIPTNRASAFTAPQEEAPVMLRVLTSVASDLSSQERMNLSIDIIIAGVMAMSSSQNP